MKNLILIFLVLFSSCAGKQRKCEDIKDGTATLIGYKVAKHSHMLFYLNETGTTHDVGGMGGRREPSIKLNSTIKVKYCVGKDGSITLLVKGRDYAKYPKDRTSRRVNYQ